MATYVHMGGARLGGRAEDERRVVADSEPAHQVLELGLLDQVSLDRILQVVAPVQLHGAGDVPLLVEIGVLVYLGDDDTGVFQMLRHPIGGDQHRVCIAVLRHALPFHYFYN